MKYDVIIIGGGPAGMMAAGKAGESGARVVLIEKNAKLGVKLLISGGGRCNITNKVENIKELVNKFGSNGKFLFSAFAKFGPEQVIEFFENRGVKTKTEDNGRVFPVSNKSQDVLKALTNYLKESGVEIKLNCEVKKIIQKENKIEPTLVGAKHPMGCLAPLSRLEQKNISNKIEKIILTSGEEIITDKFIIATGGKSYPKLGSNGDGYKWLQQLGHTITETYPALTQINIPEKIVKKLEGLSLKNIKITLIKNDQTDINTSWNFTSPNPSCEEGNKKFPLLQGEKNSKNFPSSQEGLGVVRFQQKPNALYNKPIASQTGDAIFTSNGLSGPAALTLSKEVNKEKDDKIILAIDFLPELTFEELDKKLLQIFQTASNKIIKNSLDILLPAKLIAVITELTNINPEKKSNSITKEERLKILHLLKEFKLKTTRSTNYNQAMVTAGGVNLEEVDPQTMRSKIIDNLYLAGEIIDLDAPTGGYNLQMCWSTGFVAGK